MAPPRFWTASSARPLWFGWLPALALWPFCALAGEPVAAPAPAPDAHYWSLQAPRRTPPPAVQQTAWCRNPVDQFVLAELEQAGLSPTPEADRATLLRRVTFDLTGLPPTPAEIANFRLDHSAGAYEKVVDRLLASPRYGERWARHWLDVVRFAESHGFEMNQPRNTAWPYRDYVIRAFNEDLPYDRFVFEQLAGDTVGVDEATGFLVAGPWDQVKSPDEQLTKQQRADELHDMVATAGTAFLGLTVGCARCHDHKFDPLSQRDYYSLQAVFTGVNHGERTWRAADETRRVADLAAVRAELATLDPRLARFEPPARVPAPADTNAVPRRPAVTARRNTDRFAPVTTHRVRFTITASSGGEPGLDELEIFTAGEHPTNAALAGAGAKLTVSGTLPGYAIHQAAHLNDGRYGNEWSWISADAGRGWVQVEFPAPTTIDRVVWSRDRSGGFADRVTTGYRIETATADEQWVTVADAADRLPYRTPAAPGGGYSAAGRGPAAAAELAELLARRARLEQRAAELAVTRKVYSGQFAPPATAHLLYRGDPLQPREAVTPAGPARVTPEFQLPDSASDAERRAGFARWLTDPRNPLPARVIVNRLWHYHFGQGLVGTPSDFGAMGGRPSHPALLDWLATELPAAGWRLNPIQRLLVLSATYRQGGDGRPDAEAKDAGNRLLWRFAPQRLEAEELRDAILATSGKLDLRMGGPGFDVFQPNDNYVRVYSPKETFGPDEWRRMIYQFKPRMQQDGVFGAFDCPDGAQIAPQRSSSITALQALNLLNSGFLLQQAGFFAERLEQEAGAGRPAQIERAFALAFGRHPTAHETAAALELVSQAGLPALCRALFNANEFVFVF